MRAIATIQANFCGWTNLCPTVRDVHAHLALFLNESAARWVEGELQWSVELIALTQG